MAFLSRLSRLSRLFPQRPPRGPFLVRYASALGSGWQRDHFDEALTLGEARAQASARRKAGYYSQIVEKVGGAVVK